MSTDYVELHAHSAFTLLEGASAPEHLAARAAALGYRAMALTDRDDLGGQVRFCEGNLSLKRIVGAEVTLENDSHLVLLAKDAEGYRNLCSLVSKSRFLQPRGWPSVSFEDVARHTKGLIALSAFFDGPIGPALLAHSPQKAAKNIEQWVALFDDDFYFEVWDHTLVEQHRAIELTVKIAHKFGTKVVLTNHVHHALRTQKPLQDVLRCIAHHTTLDAAGDILFPNDLRYLRDPKRMAQSHPQFTKVSVEIAEQCSFSIRDLEVPLPCFPEIKDGEDPHQTLVRLTWEGAKVRYGHLRLTDNPDTSNPLVAKHLAVLNHELQVIEKLRFSLYFLILYDIVQVAAQKNILVSGRGSAANSAVCFCLGITQVDPIGRDLLFERFLSEGRSEPPDIDLDIEHNAREQILQYVYERYGRQYAAMVCTVVTYGPKMAARDVARVLGFSVKQGDCLARACSNWVAHDPDPRMMNGSRFDLALAQLADAKTLENAGLDPQNIRVQWVPWLVRNMVGLPRQRGIHTGGFVLSSVPLHEICPIEWATMPDRTVLQWEKDDLATLGIVKFDLLGLGILALLHESFDLVKKHRGEELSLWSLPAEDPKVFDMLCEGDSLGVFQVESRAQMNTLPRLLPRQFYDLCVQVALIRPGPIQGEMVHPYLRRRAGEEPVTYLHPDLESHLARTLGVPLFQEQGMKVAMAMGDFSASEADQLRRAMGHRRARPAMEALCKELFIRMQNKGVPESIANRILKQLNGFSEYGFPESHAIAFGNLVYASAYVKCHFLPEFYVALLNCQPMGFYTPASIIEDAKRHQLPIFMPDVRQSSWDCTVEGSGIRMGLRYIKGLAAAAKQALESVWQLTNESRPATLADFFSLVTLDENEWQSLARAGALDSFWPSEMSAQARKKAIWQAMRLARAKSGPLTVMPTETQIPLFSALSEHELMVTDWVQVGVSSRDHPLAFLRSALDASGVLSARALYESRQKRVRVAGLVTVRQMPMTAHGFLFITLEDEGGMSNIVVRPDVLESNRALWLEPNALTVEGILQRKGKLVTVLAQSANPLSLDDFRHSVSRDFH